MWYVWHVVMTQTGHFTELISNLTSDLSSLSPQGHAAPVLYAVWAETGYLKENELLNLRKVDSILEGHPVPVRWHSDQEEVLDLKAHVFHYINIYTSVIQNSFPIILCVHFEYFTVFLWKVTDTILTLMQRLWQNFKAFVTVQITSKAKPTTFDSWS